MTLSRRHFIAQIAAVAGQGAAQAAMSALGSDSSAEAASGPPPQPRPADLGRGKRVVVVGAGIAGLVAGLELGRLGFDVTVLEARDRIGGRNLTLREGARVDMADGTSQRVSFDGDLYFNAGAARIPHTHRTILGYCRQLGVPVEVLVNASRSALCDPGAAISQRPIELSRVQNDARGYIAELLAKSTKQGLLDGQLTREDRDRLMELLRTYGALGDDDRYTGSSRSGYRVPPGAANAVAVDQEPLDFGLFLHRELWRPLVFEEYIEYQSTMLQPVGGMDRLAYALAQPLADRIRLSSAVLSIERGEGQAKVLYKDGSSGERALIADFAVVTIPLPVLAGVANNFDAGFERAIQRAVSLSAYKIAWQAPRFWETHAGIYGGMSFVSDASELVWYPSHGFLQPKGVLIGAYNVGDDARQFTEKSLPDQYQACRATVERLHPGHGASLEHPVCVDWHKMPFSMGAWASWNDPASPDYSILNEPQGNVYLAGEHLSHLTGWQEGAALSALHAVHRIADATQRA
jgi:monoamine oxidase